MDTTKKIREHISALCDGELPASDLELGVAALQTDDGREAWEAYHRIGDVLRGQPSPDLSPGFAAALAARLAAERVPAPVPANGSAGEAPATAEVSASPRS